jgi:hypothetical protein
MSAFSRREFLKTGLGVGVGLAASGTFPTSLSAEVSPPSQRVILLVLDGLRPDRITPELMPHTHQLASRGVFFADNHAVYPTTTMMNAAALATVTWGSRSGPSRRSISPVSLSVRRSIGSWPATPSENLTAS